MVQVEMSNMYIDMNVINGSDKWTEKTLRLTKYVYWLLLHVAIYHVASILINFCM